MGRRGRVWGADRGSRSCCAAGEIVREEILSTDTPIFYRLYDVFGMPDIGFVDFNTSGPRPTPARRAATRDGGVGRRSACDAPCERQRILGRLPFSVHHT